MKKFTFMLIAAFVAVASWAGVPVKKSTVLQPQNVVLKDAVKKAPMHFRTAAPFKVQVPVNNRFVAKAKSNARKAPRKVAVEDFFDKDFMLCSEYYDYDETEGLVEATPAAGGTPITISKIDDETVGIDGFIADATETIQATLSLKVDEELAAEGVVAVVTIAEGQTLLRDDTYGPVSLFNADEGDIIAYVLENGYVMFDDLWYYGLGEDYGTYPAGTRMSDYNYSVVVPANGKMAFADNEGNEENVIVYIDQDPESPKTVTVYNFGGYEAAVDVSLKEDQSFVIDAQPLFYYNSTYGYFYVAGLLISGGSYYLDTLTGIGTENALTFNGTWMVYSPTKGSIMGIYEPAVITLTDGEFVYPVIPDVAAKPADPEILAVNNYDAEKGYGSVAFTIPTTDVDGNDIKEDKLFYQLYSDINGDIQPIVFTPEICEMLEEDMTIIPYTFTDNWDFQDRGDYKVVFLNYNFNKTYDRIGVKSIYTGGGETNESEIVWEDVEKEEPAGPSGTFDFNALTEAQQPVSTSNTHDGDIPKEGQVLQSGVVSLAVSASTTSTPNRYWKTTDYGIQLRVYGGTLTFEVPEGYTITGIDCNAPTWSDSNTFDPESEKIEEEIPAQHYLWAGSAEKVTLTVNGKTFFNSIVVTVEGGDEPGPEEEAIDPEGKTYTFDDSDMEGWTAIDADGDGYNWVLGSAVGGIYLAAGSSLAGNGHGSSADFVVSGSRAFRGE